MDKPTAKKHYAVAKLDVTVEFSDRGLTASRRPIGHVDLGKTSIKCEHPDCEGAEVPYRSQLRQKISELKKKGEKAGSFVVRCLGSKKDSRGTLTCGGFYIFNVEVDYEADDHASQNDA